MTVPLITIKADSVPEAHYKSIFSIWEEGLSKRTQYDRKDPDGNYIDPPSKDAQAVIRINNLFNEPMFPVLSFCERGKYILEILGYKDNMVLSPESILNGVANNNLGTEWPYSYSQRINAFPIGSKYINPSYPLRISQIENIIERLSEDFNSRRSVVTTRCPTLDIFLKEDLPCLGEIHFRCFENESKILELAVTTIWRSRDLFKAWADNVVALSFWFKKISEKLSIELNREVILGAYTEFNNSLHIYGQDFAKVEGDVEKGRKSFFDKFPTIESYVEKSWDSAKTLELEIIPQMKEILTETTWNFNPKQIDNIKKEIKYFEDILKNLSYN